MKTIARVCALLLTTAAISLPAAAQTATVHGDLTKDWTNLKDTLVKMTEAMPEDKFTFKPTPAQRTFAEQVLHIAQVNVTLLKAVGPKATPPEIDMNTKTKAAVVKALAASFDFGAAALKEFDDTTIRETVQPPFLGPSTRARVVYFLLGHTWDTYGQMAVYLRLNGVTPPASQRP